MPTKNIIITVIIALVVGGAAFYGGTVYEKSSLNKQGLLRSASRGQVGQSQGQGQFSRQGGPNGAGFGRGGDGGFSAGEIIAKDDKSITIKTNDGGSKIVFFSDSTQIGKTAQGSSSDLASGQQVMANGTANQDGTITAQNIQIRPAQ
jgi:hypothetical protein